MVDFPKDSMAVGKMKGMLYQSFSAWVKVFSSLLITGALGLELGNIMAQGSLFSAWPVVFYLGRLVLIGHAVEGLIAAVYAPSKNRSPLSTGFYTFFVGTVGLVELFQPPTEHETR
jgi:hypothetical protein